MTQINDTANPRVDWRTLSEETGYRVLTLPDGSTIDADVIGRVRIVEPRVCEVFPDEPARPRYVQVFGKGSAFFGMSLLAEVTEDVDDFFAMATAVHRRAAVDSAKAK